MKRSLATHSFAALQKAAETAQCVVCDAPGARLVTAPVADQLELLELDDYVPDISLCPACTERLNRALRRFRITLYLGTPTPFVAAAIAVIALPFSSILAPLITFAIAAILSFIILQHARRSAARSVPLLVAGGSRDEITFLITTRAQDESHGTGPYRQGAKPHVGLALRNTTRPAGRRISRGLWFYLFDLAAGAVVMLYIWPQIYPQVVLDNWSHRVFRVSIDDREPITVEPRSDQVIRLRYGHHSFTTHRRDGSAQRQLEANLPWGENHALGLAGERCYAERSATFSRGYRFARSEMVKADTTTQTGRWVHVADPMRITSVPCHPDPVPPIFFVP